MRETASGALSAPRGLEPGKGRGSAVRPAASLLAAFPAPVEPIASVEIPRCDKCKHPMRRASPDNLGPICRARLAAETGIRISPLTVTRATTALVDGQMTLFEHDQLEEEQ